MSEDLTVIRLLLERLFHVDDVPSGAGDGIQDVKKAQVVGIRGFGRFLFFFLTLSVMVLTDK